MQNLTPFINEITHEVGFFLFEAYIETIYEGRMPFFGMSKGDVTLEINKYIDNLNRYLFNASKDELFNKYLNETGKIINFDDFDISDEVVWNNIKGRVPTPIEGTDYRIKQLYPSESDYIKLNQILRDFPEISHPELVEIFYNHKIKKPSEVTNKILSDKIDQLALTFNETLTGIYRIVCDLYSENVALKEKLNNLEKES